MFAQCVVAGVSGLPDSCEYADIDETPDFSSSSTESQTDFTVADIMLQEDTTLRCSTPNWDGLSATFEENLPENTYPPGLNTSAV
ncbi:hypothetical protein V5799_012291 [Amblyomma americanum]|uniref:Uncharacterized protein n=1 Tax=Amblyomma americanum TaxID=6943 RepID=A0AAQ4EEL5_AMBAM